MGDMTPRVPEWTDKQIDEFVEAVAYLRERLAAAYLQRTLDVSRQTLCAWQSRQSAPSADNRDAVLALAKSLQKALP